MNPTLKLDLSLCLVKQAGLGDGLRTLATTFRAPVSLARGLGWGAQAGMKAAPQGIGAAWKAFRTPMAGGLNSAYSDVVSGVGGGIRRLTGTYRRPPRQSIGQPTKISWDDLPPDVRAEQSRLGFGPGSKPIFDDPSYTSPSGMRYREPMGLPPGFTGGFNG